MKKKNTKKLLSVLLTVIMLLCSLPFVSFAQDTQGNIVWSFDEATATLTVGGEGAIKDYGLPGDGGFDPPAWWKFLRKADKIVIEEGITEIGGYNFFRSTAKEIVFPSSLRKIGFSAFMGNTDLKEIILPEGVETIDMGAFASCPMVEKVYVPESVKEIYDSFSIMLYSFILKEFVFLPDSAQFYSYLIGGFDDYSYAEAASYYYKYKIDADVSGYEDSDEFVYLKMSEYLNEKFKTSFPLEYSKANENSLEDFLFKNSVYHVPAWVSYVCKKESAQHEMFKNLGITHKIYETGEVCNCFQTTGTYGENITWSLDLNTRTLTFDGTGPMPEEDPEYAELMALFENVRFAENSTITEISNSSLSSIFGVKSIVIPASVKRINKGYYDISSLGNIASVTVDDGNAVYFDDDGVVYEKTDSGITLIYCSNEKTGEFSVPEYVTAIGSYAFIDSNLEKITIPETVKSFGCELFDNCYADVYFYDSAKADIDNNILLDFYGTLHCRPDSKLCDKFNYFREFNVEMIEEKEIDHIEIETLPDKTVYVYRETDGVDLTGLTVRVFFTDGTSEVRSSCYAREDDFSTWKIGKTTLPVCYGRYETAIDVTVSPIEYTDINIGESKTETNNTNDSYYVYFRFVPEVTAEYQFNYDSDGYGVSSEIFDQSMKSFASKGWEGSSMNEILFAGETYYISMFVSSNDTCTISIDENYHPASEWIIDKEPTCITIGSKHKECLDCGKTLETCELLVDPDANGELSDWIVDTDSTCTAAGKKHKECTDCHEILERSDIDRIGHTPVVVPGKAATCEEAGLTEGKHCSVCNEVLVAQEVVPAKGHTEVVDAAVAPTCTETGLTEGKHCSVCNKVLVAQETIPAKEHTDSNNDGNCDTCGKKLRELTVVEKIKAFFQKILDWFRKLFS